MLAVRQCMPATQLPFLMKIQIASDLHLEILEKKFPSHQPVGPSDADVLIIAGDIHRDTQALAAFADWPVPVIYVHGNHEGYHEQYEALIDKLHSTSRHGQVRHLENEETILHGVRFLGCCLWTDYALIGDIETSMQEAEKVLVDHKIITTPGGVFTPQDALAKHRQSRAWLTEKLATAFDGPTVVITHHGVHPDSVHPRFAGSSLNPAFISDLTPLVAKADLWIHGHVHDSFDYQVAGTRVVTNPRGYPLNLGSAETVADIEWENPGFNPQLVIEIDAVRKS